MDLGQKRLLQLEGIQNLRELGGYTNRSGKKIRYKCLLRSGNLDQVRTKSQTELLNYGVNHIIDVRDEWEQVNYPNVFSEIEQVHYQNIPFIGNSHLKDAESTKIMDEADNLSDTYAFLLENCKPQILNILKAIAQSKEEDCTIVHCVAGKDRTGLVIALVLSAIDIPDEIIIKDYAYSGRWSDEFEKHWQNEVDDPQAVIKRRRDAAATEEIMQQVLRYLQEEYGGSLAYLEAIGCDHTLRKKLQSQLLDS